MSAQRGPLLAAWNRCRPLRWALCTLPGRAIAGLLSAEIAAAAVATALLAVEPATSDTLVRCGVLAALSIGYGMFARSTRAQRYLGTGRVWSNPMSVWSYAAVLTVPAGWAAAFVAVQYGHVLAQRWRDKTGMHHRTLFSAAAAILAQLAAAGVVELGGDYGGLAGHPLASLAAVAGAPVFVAVNSAVLLTGMHLATGRDVRTLLPDRETLLFELGTLGLGVAAAEFLVHSLALVPLTLILVAFVHRSSVVRTLQTLARTDPKTGLLSPAGFTEAAQTTLSRTLREQASVATLLIDLDRFKSINDTHGHLVGDQVLATVGACLSGELRGYDALGRFGGEEFVAVLDGVTASGAGDIATRLRIAISELVIGEQQLRVTASIGLAYLPAQAAHPAPGRTATDLLNELLHAADRALYEAKEAGRNRVRQQLLSDRTPGHGASDVLAAPLPPSRDREADHTH